MTAKLDIDSPKQPVRGLVGIYVLSHASIVVYVGQSVHIEKRVEHHASENRRHSRRGTPQFIKPFDRVDWFPVDESKLDAAERWTIRELNPRLNGKRASKLADHAVAHSLGIKRCTDAIQRILEENKR